MSSRTAPAIEQRTHLPANDGKNPDIASRVFALQIVSFSAGATIAFNDQKAQLIVYDKSIFKSRKGWSKIWFTGTVVFNFTTDPEEAEVFLSSPGATGLVDANGYTIVVGPPNALTNSAVQVYPTGTTLFATIGLALGANADSRYAMNTGAFCGRLSIQIECTANAIARVQVVRIEPSAAYEVVAWCGPVASGSKVSFDVGAGGEIDAIVSGAVYAVEVLAGAAGAIFNLSALNGA